MLFSRPMAISLALLLAASRFALASSPDVSPAIEAAIQSRLAPRPVQSIAATPVKDVYEVVLGPNTVVYLDASGRYAFAGELLDLSTKASLTAQRMDALRATDFDKLPLTLAFKIVRGTGARKVAMFSDPDCPYCKRFERETLSAEDNITIYVFPFLLTENHPDAQRKATLLWCAAEPSKAWQTWMASGKLPAASRSCATPFEAVDTLAAKLGVRATPTLVFTSGKMVVGGIDRPTFEANLTATAASVARR